MFLRTFLDSSWLRVSGAVHRLLVCCSESLIQPKTRVSPVMILPIGFVGCLVAGSWSIIHGGHQWVSLFSSGRSACCNKQFNNKTIAACGLQSTQKCSALIDSSYVPWPVTVKSLCQKKEFQCYENSSSDSLSVLVFIRSSSSSPSYEEKKTWYRYVCDTWLAIEVHFIPLWTSLMLL